MSCSSLSPVHLIASRRSTATCNARLAFPPTNPQYIMYLAHKNHCRLLWLCDYSILFTFIHNEEWFPHASKVVGALSDAIFRNWGSDKVVKKCGQGAKRIVSLRWPGFCRVYTDTERIWEGKRCWCHWWHWFCSMCLTCLWNVDGWDDHPIPFQLATGSLIAFTKQCHACCQVTSLESWHCSTIAHGLLLWRLFCFFLNLEWHAKQIHQPVARPAPPGHRRFRCLAVGSRDL